VKTAGKPLTLLGSCERRRVCPSRSLHNGCVWLPVL